MKIHSNISNVDDQLPLTVYRGHALDCFSFLFLNCQSFKMKLIAGAPLSLAANTLECV